MIVKNKTRYVVATGFYAKPEWRELRVRVITKYGRVCMCCGKKTKGRDTHVDHIEPRSKRPDLELVFDNLQILCKSCNDNKGNEYAKDYRPKEGSRTIPRNHRKTAKHWADGYTVEEVLVAQAAVEAHRKAKQT